MRLALIADVHGNWQALDTVLAELAPRGVDRIACLGDVVGYGADPDRCIDRLASAAIPTVLGNHDRGALADAAEAGTSADARYVMGWTQRRLSEAQRAWLSERPTHATEEGVLLAHGCFLNDSFYRGYVTSTMLDANLARIASRDEWPPIAACGHTHVPMIGWLTRDGAVIEQAAHELVRWPADARAVLVNPGAVGQPRDGDPRASCAVLDLEARTFEVIRVGYDVDAAAAAIVAAGLPDGLAARLARGR